MARETKEWIGKTDNEPIPPRVRLRVFARADGRCKCTKRIMAGETWGCDHIIALINGGKNRESNLQVLCVNCHSAKTGADLAEKSYVYSVRKKHLGLKKPKWKPMPGTKRSGIRKRMNGKVESW